MKLYLSKVTRWAVSCAAGVGAVCAEVEHGSAAAAPNNTAAAPSRFRITPPLLSEAYRFSVIARLVAAASVMSGGSQDGFDLMI
ncbi:MAG: hypothetical protein ACTHMG_10655 [Sphingomonas sp.]